MVLRQEFLYRMYRHRAAVRPRLGEPSVLCRRLLGLLLFGFADFSHQCRTLFGRGAGNGRDLGSSRLDLAGKHSLPCAGNSFFGSVYAFGKAFCSPYKAVRCICFTSDSCTSFFVFWLVVILTTNQTCILVSPFFIWYQSLFSVILLSNKVLLLFWGEIAPPKLVFANPDDCFIAVCKLFS